MIHKHQHLRHRITGLALIPSVIHQLVNYPGISKANFATILGMSSGAAYLPPDLAQKMSNLVPGGVVFTEGACQCQQCFGFCFVVCGHTLMRCILNI